LSSLGSRLFFYIFGDPEIFVCHNKLVSKFESLFYGMATTKFKAEKFDGHNSFSLWRLKMRDLLRQQGLAKILDGEVLSTSSTEEMKELERKGPQCNIVVSFRWSLERSC
jgi:hypothetical protein